MSISISAVIDRVKARFARSEAAEETMSVTTGRFTPELIFDDTRTAVMGVNDAAHPKLIEIPGHVKKISKWAFRHNRDIEAIYIPDSVTEIAEYAFADCGSLRKVRMPDTLVGIPKGCFYMCKKLSEVIWPSSLRKIGSDAFSQTALKKIKLPERLAIIEKEAFRDTPLVSVKFGRCLKTIGVFAFFRCTGLSSVELPEGLVKIDTNAFGGCSGIRSLYLPDSLKEIGNTSFSKCFSIEKLRAPTGFSYWNEIIPSFAALETLTVDKYEIDLGGLVGRNTNKPSLFIGLMSDVILGSRDDYDFYFRSLGKPVVFSVLFRLAFAGCPGAKEYLLNGCNELCPDDVKEISAAAAERLLAKYGESVDCIQLSEFLDIMVKFGLHEAYVIMLQYKRDRFGFDGDDSEDGSFVGDRFDL